MYNTPVMTCEMVNRLRKASLMGKYLHSAGSESGCFELSLIALGSLKILELIERVECRMNGHKKRDESAGEVLEKYGFKSPGGFRWEISSGGRLRNIFNRYDKCADGYLVLRFDEGRGEGHAWVILPPAGFPNGLDKRLNTNHERVVVDGEQCNFIQKIKISTIDERLYSDRSTMYLIQKEF